ncbi:thioredoxin domain-containing protein [Sphingobacterium sp. DK4209]|uniref:Thioredoxin domain-containing protein n=1 Tax=Sphingobacterium zhuxiongii TaxID=2662364 RepID=A0A5Q0QJ97_9SPHI|nr:MULTISPECIES: DsbA family oxidoreductase [unclassified Sphingobacterium]MVZ65873.1 thioredoxin domain-containing protein [Sphingobacterium sp. DK4209]QGA28112.1 thioredoxin domain-containing protein [Sphingobacterium sp. dk4302]
MVIEIWSDIMCPFCYIGKHHFEKALAAVDFKNQIQVVYKSYQLNPETNYVPGETVYSLLSKSKGLTIEQAKEMTSHVVKMANEAGLTINFDTNIPASTFKSHVMIHLAADKGKAEEMNERLFEAHFVSGLNIEDEQVLKTMGESLGLTAAEIQDALASEKYAYAVKQDIQESRQIGIRGVPFFLFDRKYAISGAQPVDSFVEVLQKSFKEWKDKNPEIQLLNDQDGDSTCGPEGCII